MEKEKFYCEYCEVDFGGRKYGFQKHLKTKKHLRNVERAQKAKTCVPCPSPSGDNKDEQITALVELVKNLQQNITELQNKTPPPTSHAPFELAQIPVGKKKYSIERILNRKDTPITYPREKWKPFIMKAYYYECDDVETIITNRFSCLTKAANLLIQKFKDCDKEDLPILVLNKRGGLNNKIAYYESSNGIFTTRTNIEKKRDIQLWRLLEVYLAKSMGQWWDEKKLKEIYREMPIEIRDKMFYKTTEDNKLSFLDFWCECRPCDHCIGCYKDVLYREGLHKVYKFKDRELVSPQGQTFSLHGDEFKDFVEDYLNAIREHEHFEVFINYQREALINQDLWLSTCEDLDLVCDRLFDAVCELCNVNTILN